MSTKPGVLLAVLACVLGVGACKGVSCTDKHLYFTTTFDGTVYNDHGLEAARAAGWACDLTRADRVFEVQYIYYTCTRCD